MKGLSMVAIALLALLGCTMELHAAESEIFTGTAARSGTYKRPLLNVDGKRYEVKASYKAAISRVKTPIDQPSQAKWWKISTSRWRSSASR